jgi:hypothetical protein
VEFLRGRRYEDGHVKMVVPAFRAKSLF